MGVSTHTNTHIVRNYLKKKKKDAQWPAPPRVSWCGPSILQSLNRRRQTQASDGGRKQPPPDASTHTGSRAAAPGAPIGQTSTNRLTSCLSGLDSLALTPLCLLQNAPTCSEQANSPAAQSGGGSGAGRMIVL